MFRTILQNKDKNASKSRASDFILERGHRYLHPLQLRLDALIDTRLVSTFYDLFMAILVFRHNRMGLLLSELGGYICGLSHAPAGTKRISNLLRCKKWSSTLIDDFFFERSRERIKSLQSNGQRPLLLWDESKIEKSESWFLEGLCSVESSKGKRLTKIRKGFYKPPTQRICVPGFHWTATLLSALGQTPSVCQMSWWTSRGKYQEVGTNIIFRMLKKLHKTIGSSVLHVLDRGYANAWTIEWMNEFKQDFLVRWKKTHLLCHSEKGTKQTHLLARSFKAVGRKMLRDNQRKISKYVTIAYTQVTHGDFKDKPLWLIIVRDKKSLQPPMYLLTSIAITNTRLAWEMCHSYMHRWNIEQTFRCSKAELGMESPRLWFWENRLKLLAIVALVYDFLLMLLRNWSHWIPLFLRHWCHRTGNRYRNASIPIYRLRLAISHVLYTACCACQTSG
ncbi:transposase [Runella slithyformis]|uniref:Transposase IS4-like domain-containing protein n=1 Tax=Runella slithyformis (strain ATCC 29530 / DSM 19594 / LMG 11500 / NCIMB 11436 / LSU 4) TaxID=761193 RepID=A0A7U3ZQL0_RUNSL|nr:transposase [Runella slithyformis]AEI51488.1 hypothetical protein Runsl_5188 [Runella slithyformis DSM 19594]